MDENCYFHKDTPAIKWREPIIFSEPNRVPLCNICLLGNFEDIFSTYPLNEYHMDQDILLGEKKW